MEPVLGCMGDERAGWIIGECEEPFQPKQSAEPRACHEAEEEVDVPRVQRLVVKERQGGDLAPVAIGIMGMIVSAIRLETFHGEPAGYILRAIPGRVGARLKKRDGIEPQRIAVEGLCARICLCQARGPVSSRRTVGLGDRARRNGTTITADLGTTPTN
nr:hypothetical protein [Breoghania sp.]